MAIYFTLCTLLANEWAQRPTTVPTNCPPGLEYLTQIDQILVHQQMEILESIINFSSLSINLLLNLSSRSVYWL